jgi:hypothetical protein
MCQDVSLRRDTTLASGEHLSIDVPEPAKRTAVNSAVSPVPHIRVLIDAGRRLVSQPVAVEAGLEA